MVGGRIKEEKGEYIMTEKENKILPKILKERPTNEGANNDYLCGAVN